MFVYILYLTKNLKSHTYLFIDEIMSTRLSHRMGGGGRLTLELPDFEITKPGYIE